MDSATMAMQAACEARRLEMQESAKRLAEISRQRLLKIIETKLRTAFIGAMATFEAEFGALWGHGNHDRDCTPDQLRWRAIWNDRVRPVILNNGNNQVRAMQSEVVLYDVKFNGYQNKLEIRKEAE